MEKELLIEQLDKFFNAETVAVIGASSKPKKIGYQILRNLSQYDYRGRVYPINPKVCEILNLKCYRSILDVPDKIDLVVMAVSSIIGTWWRRWRMRVVTGWRRWRMRVVSG